MKTAYESPAARTVRLSAEGMMALSFFEGSSSGSGGTGGAGITADPETKGGGQWGAGKDGGYNGNVWKYLED